MEILTTNTQTTNEYPVIKQNKDDSSSTSFSQYMDTEDKQDNQSTTNPKEDYIEVNNTTE